MRTIKCYTQRDIIVLKEIASENLGWVKQIKKVHGKYVEFSLHSLNPKYVNDIYFQFLKFKRNKK